MKEYMVTYRNFRGKPARMVVWAKSENGAQEQFNDVTEGTPNERAEILTIEEQK